MRKRILSLCLALTMCLALSVSAAAVGETSITPKNSGDPDLEATFHLSNPVAGTEQWKPNEDWVKTFTVYQVPVGTVVTVSFPEAQKSLTDLGLNVATFTDPSDSRSQGQYGIQSFTVTEHYSRIETNTKPQDSIFVRGIASGSADTVKPADPAGTAQTPADPAGTAQTPAAPAFTDVAADAYFAAPVAWAVEKGITSGKTATTFAPAETCSRAQIITFLWRAAGSPEPKNPDAPLPADVKAGAYYAKAAAWAVENGMVSGGAFSPDAPCTREMAVEFMWKQAGSPSAAKASFTDVSSDAVNWAVEKGVTSGTSASTFSPANTCTRGQIVTFLYRAFAA